MKGGESGLVDIVVRSLGQSDLCTRSRAAQPEHPAGTEGGHARLSYQFVQIWRKGWRVELDSCQGCTSKLESDSSFATVKELHG